MKEKIKTIYESVLLVTGYTRKELSERYAISSDKRIAQNILLRMLLRNLKRTEVIRITGINGNAVSKLSSTEPTQIEAIVYKAAWSLYTALMHRQVSVRDFSPLGKAKIKHINSEEDAIVTLKDIRQKIKNHG